MKLLKFFTLIQDGFKAISDLIVWFRMCVPSNSVGILGLAYIIIGRPEQMKRAKL